MARKRAAPVAWPPDLPPEDLIPMVLDLAVCVADIALRLGCADAVLKGAARRNGPASQLLAGALEKAKEHAGLKDLPAAGTAD